MAQDPIHALWVAIADATGYDINSNEVKALARYLSSRWLPLAKSALEAGTASTIKTYFEGHRIVDTSSAIAQHHPESWHVVDDVVLPSGGYVINDQVKDN